MMGGGPQGMMQGMQVGGQMQEQARKRMQEQQRAEALKGALGGMQLNPQEQQFLTANPDAGSEVLQRILAERLDPMSGIKRKTAELGIRSAEEDLAMAPLRRQYTRAQIDALSRKAEPDAVEQFIMQRLGRAGGGVLQAQPQTPQSPIQPQSFDGSGLQGGGLQLIADQQPAPPAAMGAAPDTVDTPYGTMSRQEARELGGTMLLNPKFAPAGKALLDAADIGSATGLAKPTVNQIEERTLNSTGQLGRLNDIMKRFDPKFLDISSRMKMMGASWTSKFGGKLPTDVESELGRYASFRSAAVNNLNTILKEMSGAAVTPQEYERIQNDQPVAGTGIFDGDDPVSFKAKAERTTTSLKAAIARYNFMRTRGLNFDRGSLDQFMNLEDVPAVIDQRGAEIEQQLRQANPKADPMTIEKNVKQQLKREFGI